MNPGELRHKLYIIKPAHTQSTSGGVTQSYTIHGTVWGRVMPMTGRERMAAGQVESVVDHRVIIRYLAGVRDDMRMLVPKEETTITAAIATTNGTTIALAREVTVTNEPYPLRVDDEIVTVTTAGNGSLNSTMVRGAYGTTAATHLINTVAVRLGLLEISAIIDKDERRETLEILCAETR